MDNIEKWLKSLRLHKYTHLFKAMTYDEMLALEEKYLIDKEVTKGARNKMLISIKKLNLRRERLINMIDDLNLDNISMKEALTVLKDMLVTPIPPPPTTTTPTTPTTQLSVFADQSPRNNNSNNNHLSPYELTHLFIDTLEKVAYRMIECAGMEDNACHGIMAAIVDECLKHNSFTKEQKVKVASFRQHFSREQKAKLANNFRTRPHNYHHHYQQPQQQQSQLPLPPLPLHQTQSHNHQHHLNLLQYHQQHHHPLNPLNHHQFQQQQYPPIQQQHPSHPLPIQQQTHQQQKQDQHQNQFHHYHYAHLASARNVGGGSGGGPIQPPSLSASLSTIGSTASNSADEEEQQQQQHQQVHRQHPVPPPPPSRQTYKEYSLLEPGMTFELPCLRAQAAAEKLNRRQLCFLSVFQS